MKDFWNNAAKRAETAGSAAFTIWVKLTAPALKETTAPKWVNVWRIPTGNKDCKSFIFTLGGERIPKNHTGNK